MRKDEAAEMRKDEAAEMRKDEAAEMLKDEAAEMRKDEAAEMLKDEAAKMRKDQAAKMLICNVRAKRIISKFKFCMLLTVTGGFLYVIYSTLLHLPARRFHCVGGCVCCLQYLYLIIAQ
jgi:hypothetical protein